MTIELTEQEGCRRLLHVELPAEDVVAEFARVSKSFQRQAQIKGFRAGKAPAAIVEKKFADQIDEEASQRLTGQAYRDAVKEKAIEVASLVNIENVVVSKTEGFKADYTVDIVPAFDLAPYTDLEVAYEKHAVSDDDCAKTLESFRQRAATISDATDDHALAEGDFCHVSYEGSIDGGPLEIADKDNSFLASDKDSWVRVGVDGYSRVKNLCAAVVGLKKGDAFELDVAYEDDCHVESLRGRSVHYKGTILSAQSLVLPEVDDAFAKNFGSDSVDALKVSIRQRLESYSAEENERRLFEALCKKLIADNPFTPPAGPVERETSRIVQEIVSNGLRQGVEKDKMLEDKEKIYEEAKRVAEGRIALRYIALKIAEAEKITFTEGEVRARINSIAAEQKSTFEKVAQTLVRRGLMEDLEDDIRFSKALEFVKSHIKEA